MPEREGGGEPWGEMLLALVSFAGAMMCGTAAVFFDMLGGDQENALLALFVACACLLIFKTSFDNLQAFAAQRDSA